MQDRDLDITKFSYNAYRSLKKTLGEFDAVVECNELAILEFISQSKNKDPRQYIQQLSEKHKIKVDDVDFIKFASRIRQYYVVSVFQQSEQFLKDFKEEWQIYFKEEKWQKIEDGETKLANCLRNINGHISTELMDCYEYYRLVRNYMAHTDRDIKAIDARFKRIDTQCLKELRLDKFPNSLENINYDDFYILTNIVKHIAFVICTSSKPENQTIANVLFELSKKNEAKIYKGLKKLKNNSSRYEEALKSFAITTFGRFSSTDSEDIAKKLKSLLA